MNGQDPQRCIKQLLSLESRFASASSKIRAMRLAAMASCYRDAHDGDMAVEYFEKAIELEPNDSSYHYELGGMIKRSEFATLLDVPRALVTRSLAESGEERERCVCACVVTVQTSIVFSVVFVASCAESFGTGTE